MHKPPKKTIRKITLARPMWPETTKARYAVYCLKIGENYPKMWRREIIFPTLEEAAAYVEASDGYDC